MKMQGMQEDPLPSLYNNGALDPDLWRPVGTGLHGAARRPPVLGDLVGWRYGAWRLVEVRLTEDVDLSAKDREKLDAFAGSLKAELRAGAYERNRPRHYTFQHESGPKILKAGEAVQTLHGGETTIHFGFSPLRHGHHQFSVLPEPYLACSCHGHAWPCQEIDRAVMAEHQTRKMNRLIRTSEPGVCASCLEEITTRQRSLTFPEPSVLLPGAPGPTFHAGRSACWLDAQKYEWVNRVRDNPDTVRLASCPGITFIHESPLCPTEKRVDCTAGPDCTGLHGPAGVNQEPPCWFRVELAGNEGAHARPTFDCGYRGGNGACFGGDMSGGGTSLSPMAGDLLRGHKWGRDRSARPGANG